MIQNRLKFILYRSLASSTSNSLQGTGKTIVARLVAEILKDSGVRKKETFVESSAQKLKDMGPGKFIRPS
jgi:hypothetical protein